MLDSDVLTSFRRGHRYLGIALAAFLLVMSITGIMLNHTDALRLDRHFVPTFIAAHYYPSQNVSGFEMSLQYYFVIGNQLYLEQEALAPCGQLGGVATANDQVVVLCDGDLLLFTEENELIERLETAHGIPAGLERITSVDNQLILGGVSSVYSFDTDSFVTTPFTGREIDWPAAVQIPDDLLLVESIHWQQFILDVHSGAFAGAPGRWFADLVALLIIVMAVSGLVMWRIPK